jgi:hypothetical protein
MNLFSGLKGKGLTDALLNPVSVAHPEKTRICAICLCDVWRETYDTHMQEQHGYTTFHLGGLSDK